MVSHPRPGSCPTCGEDVADVARHRLNFHSPHVVIRFANSQVTRQILRSKDGLFHCSACKYVHARKESFVQHVKLRKHSPTAFVDRGSPLLFDDDTGPTPSLRTNAGGTSLAAISINTVSASEDRPHVPTVTNHTTKKPRALVHAPDTEQVDDDTDTTSVESSDEESDCFDLEYLSAGDRVGRKRLRKRSRGRSPSLPSHVPAVKPRPALLHPCQKSSVSHPLPSSPAPPASSELLPFLDGRPNLSHLVAGFNAFGVKTTEDLDVVCCWNSSDEWDILKSFLRNHWSGMTTVQWILLKQKMLMRKATISVLPSNPIPESHGAGCAVAQFLHSLSRPLGHRLDAFKNCGIGDAEILRTVISRSEDWEWFRDEFFAEGLTQFEWLLIREGLKKRAAQNKC